MKNRKPSSKKLWYAKKYGMYKGKKGEKEFVFTMKPIKTGWMRFPLAARAITWNFFYEPKPGVWKRGIDKNREAVIFFVPNSFDSYITTSSENLALDLNDATAVKDYITKEETESGAAHSKLLLYFKSKALRHRKNKSDSRTSLKYSKAEPEFCNEVLCSSINTSTIKIWHWDTRWIKIIGGHLVATIKEGVEELDGEEILTSLEVFISPDGHRLRPESFEFINGSIFLDIKSASLFAVKEPHKPFGYLNEKLEYVFRPEFEYAGYFDRGYAIASTTDSLFILREDGTRISFQEKISLPIVRAKSFYEGVARVSVFDITDEDTAYASRDEFDLGCWCYVTIEGKIITKPEYIIAHDMHHGLAFVCKGKWYKDPKFDNECIQGGYWSDEMLWGAIDKTGKEVIPCRYNGLSYLDDKATYFAASIIKDQEEIWGVIDRNANWIAEPQWTLRPHFLAEYLIVIRDKKGRCSRTCGVYSLKTNSIIINPEFFHIKLLGNDIIEATGYDQSTVHFDFQGNFLRNEEGLIEKSEEKLQTEEKKEDWKEKYNRIDRCTDGYKVEVSYGGYSLCGFVDFEGTSILPCIFRSFSMEKKRLVFEKKYKCGLMDFEENILIPPQYDSIRIHEDEYDKNRNPFPGKIEVRRGNYIGIFHLDGTMLIPPKYLEIKRVDNEFCLCKTKHGYDMLKIEKLQDNIQY